MALIRLNQLHAEVLNKVDEKDIAIKKEIETSMKYTIGPEAPENPVIGQRWFDTKSSLMKIWNGNGESADWELINANAVYLPGRNNVEKIITTNKQYTTGSGFLEFGGKVKLNKSVNLSLLANKGIPRLVGIEGEGESARKKFWFENFVLLNANGYDEETIEGSTKEDTRVLIDGVEITIKGTKPNSSVITSAVLNAINLPEAPNSVDELTRTELVFLEVWKEDIGETDFVFPYGNVQYTGDDCDGIQTSRFTGDIGYCASFEGDSVVETTVDQNGNEITNTVPKGKGWRWSEMKASFKNMIVSNYKHNIFVDGDKLVQIRYRIRVVKYSDNPAVPLTQFTYLGFTKDNNISSAIKAQGKLSQVKDDENYIIYAPYNKNNPKQLNGTYSTVYSSDLSFDGYVMALPLFLVTRRNQGVFDPIFNPNGTARFRDGIRLVADYDESDDIIGFALMDNANATLASSTTGQTWEDKYKIMIKWLFDRETILENYDNAKGFIIGGDMNSGISGRYDGLYYDEINVSDIKDLRIDVNKQLDLEYVLENEFNKFILGEQRGWEANKHIYYIKGNFAKEVPASFKNSNGEIKPLMDGSKRVKGYGFTKVIPVSYTLEDGTVTNGIPLEIANKITFGFSTHLYIRARNESHKDFYTNKFQKCEQVSLEPVLDENGKKQKDKDGNIIKQIVIHDREVYIDEDTEYIFASPKNNPKKEEMLYTDIIGDPLGNSYKFSTKMKVADLPSDIVLENGNIVFTGQNYYVYRGTRKNKVAIESSFMDSYGNFAIDESDTNTWVDITDKGGYSEGWKMYGNMGEPLFVDEEGKSLLPRDVTSGLVRNGSLVYQNCKFFKLSRPIESIKKVIVTIDRKAGKKVFLTNITSENNGVSIQDQVNTTPGTFAYKNVSYCTDNNTIMINWESFTDDAIIEIYYSTKAFPATLTKSSEVHAINDIWIGNSMRHNLGCIAIANLIQKIPVYNAPIGSKGAAKKIPLDEYLISKGDKGKVLNEDWAILTHKPVKLDGYGPAVKMLPYITSYNGRMRLNILYKELDMNKNRDGKAYTFDDNKFVVVNGQTTDDNGGTGYNVKVGHYKIDLPYFYGEVLN